MRMSHFNLIKHVSAENDPDWPIRNLKSLQLYPEEEIALKLSSFDFDFDIWLNYKLHVSIATPSERIYCFPRTTKLLSFDEYCSLAQAELSKDITFYQLYHFFSPTLSPQIWLENHSNFGAFGQRVWWLLDQWNWIEEGFPAPPSIIWHSERHLRLILHDLLYTPFITTWGEPSFDFWLKLSNALEADEYWFVLQAFIWAFEAQRKEFPSPSVYCLFRGQWKDAPFSVQEDSMALSQDFWLWLEQETKEDSH